MALTVIFASQIKNIQNGIDTSIFQTLKDQATLIQINKLSQNSQQDLRGRFGGGANAGGGPSFSLQDTEFTQTDIATINKIPGVVSTSLNNNVPILNIYSTDLFSGTKYTLNSLSELDSTSAGLFTTENFAYKEGEPIPIILNSNSFIQRYEDWGGKTEISLDFQNFRGTGKTNITSENNPTPIKAKAIEYNKDDLIGKTFTLNFGGLDEIQDYSIQFDNGTQKFVKLTKSEINTKVNDRKTAISKYWDYNKVSKPITYTFKVVGIISDSTSNSSYIPTSFANKVMHDYLANEIKARTTSIPVSVLNSTFTGLTYDGTKFQNNNNFRGVKMFFGGGQGARFETAGGSGNSQPVTYNIPGLVINTSTDGAGTVTGVNTDYNIYANALKTSQYLTIKIDSVFNRTSIVKALNDAGYAYQDGNSFDVFNKIQSTVQSLSLGFSIGFIIISSLVVLFAMAKFVSDSRKEIGIFRAIGMKKGEVVSMFTSQSILYVLFAYVLGIGLGIAGNYLFSPFIYSWFNNFISNTIKQSFNVVPVLSMSSFNSFDWSSILIYSAVLIIITIIVSLVPAYKASQISPVEAIKGEN
ncbi:MAG TPA: FtsX-like permease family protein [Candidatus Dojkabacteria bacterium]|nr:FtsX-like permease family protein [Candidatus Dojkabacteria bacterium]